MLKEFANECVCFAEAFEKYERTMKVLDFLKNHKGTKFTPSEIAEFLGYAFTSHYTDYKFIHYHRVVKPLYWLYRMNLIKREEIKTKITVEVGGHWGYDTIEVNGVKYQSEYHWITDGTKEVEKTSYRWYVE